MKKLLTIMALLFIGYSAGAQQVTKDAQGNYVAAKRDTTRANKPAGKTFTDSKGKVFPLFIGSHGGLYYLATSKSGKVYKRYLHID